MHPSGNCPGVPTCENSSLGMFGQETHPRRREKYREQLWEPTGLPWELGNNPGNSHPSAPHRGQEQPGFPGINQDTSKAEQASGAAPCNPLCKSWRCPREQPWPGAGKIPQICSQRPQEPQETPPGPALGFGQTPHGHQPPAGAGPEQVEPQEAAQNPFFFPVPSPGSILGSSTAQAPQPQRCFHGARDEFGISKNAKRHKSMDPRRTTEGRDL